MQFSELLPIYFFPWLRRSIIPSRGYRKTRFSSARRQPSWSLLWMGCPRLRCLPAAYQSWCTLPLLDGHW